MTKKYEQINGGRYVHRRSSSVRPPASVFLPTGFYSSGPPTPVGGWLEYTTGSTTHASKIVGRFNNYVRTCVKITFQDLPGRTTADFFPESTDFMKLRKEDPDLYVEAVQEAVRKAKLETAAVADMKKLGEVVEVQLKEF